MPLKLIGGALLALAGFSVGCLLTGRLERRRRLFEALITLVSVLSTRLRFGGENIADAVNFAAEESGIELSRLSDELPFEPEWQLAVKRLRLCSEDEALLGEFGSQLGKTDLDGQLSHLALYDSLFHKRLRDCEEELKSKARLYRALGFFAGTGAALIMI